jgi:ketosteroid isomerase-like protein
MLASMRLTLPTFVLAVFSSSCMTVPARTSPDALIAQERAALDPWGKGDPGGYLSIYDPEITYFDPAKDTRADGLPAMQAYYAPIAGKIKVDRYEMIAPKVQSRGDVAVLSYRLISHGTSASGKPYVVRWNSTKVYARSGNDWKLFHDHWSYIKPQLKEPSPE